jgi:hypothetical protein
MRADINEWKEMNRLLNAANIIAGQRVGISTHQQSQPTDSAKS